MLSCTYMYRISKRDYSKLAILLKQNNKLFHTNDLALLWQINNKNTLYTTIKRYIKKKALISIHKGFYSTIPLSQIDPVLLGIAYLHQYAYLSTETVLAKNGLISPNVPYITLISSISKTFKIGSYNYKSRKMKTQFLWQSIGIKSNGYKEASIERAVADLLYFNPHYHIDGAKSINWPAVKNIQREVGFK